MVVTVWVSVSHTEVIVLCYVYHKENAARSTTTDWQWCQEDISGPICWRKIRHLSSWSLQILWAQSSFSAPYKDIPPAQALCFSALPSQGHWGETVGIQFTTNRFNKTIWNPYLVTEEYEADEILYCVCGEVFTFSRGEKLFCRYCSKSYIF